VDEVADLMDRHGVPAGKIYRASDMLEDPQFAAREAIVDTPTEQWPDMKMQNVFPKMSRTQGVVRWTGPSELGAHNEEVYSELLGLKPEQLAKLKAKSII
jgi:formyl-CoA transferase